ncbi:MAG TPA: hypothetical protein VHE35_19645 [Kofleriaceae bacterium]|nr:hypothetical protein [Kofleriaceae bacterium]
MITHPEKVLFPADGITKGELAAYYALVAPVMLPHLRRRPVTMERFPGGIEAKGFIQKDVSRGVPAWLERALVPKHGGTVHHPLVDDARALAWMANQNCITPHVWNRRADDLEHPDLCVFDLDPPAEAPGAPRRGAGPYHHSWDPPGDGGDAAPVRAAALALRDLLAERGLPSWVKTSGSKGYHLAVPLDGTAGVAEVARFAHEVGRELVRRHPDTLTQEFAKADRGGRIYVDTGRNDHSATFAAVYAVRARPGAPVSAPCTWDEVASGAARPRTFTLRTMAARLDAVGDLWADLLAAGVALPR